MMRRAVSGALLAASPLAVASAGHAQARDNGIEAQPLDRALMLWSARTGIQVVMATDMRGVRSRQVRRGMSARDALRRLLAGTGYEARFMGEHTVVLRRVPQGPPPLPPPVPPATLADDIVVTGTRLHTTSDNAIMPVRTMGRGELDGAAQNDLVATLLRIGAIQPGLGLQSSQNQTSGGAGLSLIDLRGLGVARTLVLVDGQRQVGARRGLSAVDLNTIPQQMVERIEVTTGGGSAVYGADAVAGVVNIILRHDPVDGIELNATSALSSRGDAPSRGVSLRWGRRDVAGSGWDLSGGLYHDNIAAVDAVARGYASDGLDVIQAPSGKGMVTLHGIRFGPSDAAGSYLIGGARAVFTADGMSARAYDTGAIGVRDGRQVGGDGVAPQGYDQLRLGLARTVADLSLRRAVGAHRLAASIRVAATTTRSLWQPMIFPNDRTALSLAVDNPFLPDATVAAMRAAGVAQVDVANVLDAFGRVGSINHRLMTTARIEASGPVGDRWRYAFNLGWGRSHDAITTVGVADVDRLHQSIDAVRDPATGAIVCRDVAARAAGCVPLDIAGTRAVDPAAVAWSAIAPQSGETLTQAIVGGQLAGRPWTLPAGPVEVTIGWEARRETSDRRSSAIQERGGTYLPQVPSFAGRYGVAEVLGEVSAPLLMHRPGAERLTVTAAWRLSHYSTVGWVGAWHAGFDYAPVAAVRFRAMRSHAVRAPNIGELYSGPAQGYVFVADPCDATRRDAVAGRAARCAALGLPAALDAENGIAKPVTYLGNPALHAELADTSTLGVSWAQGGAHVTLDAWDIRVDRAIGFPIEQTTLDDCVDAADDARRLAACGAITRDAASGRIAGLRAGITNIGRIDTAGIDFTASWRSATPIAGGTIDLSATATWVGRFAVTADAASGATERTDGILPDPRLRASLGARWSGTRLSLDWQARLIGTARITADDSIAIDRPTTGLCSYHDLGIALRLASATLRLDVANVFDAAPPRRGYQTSQGIGAAALYPNLGRIVRLGATATF